MPLVDRYTDREKVAYVTSYATKESVWLRQERMASVLIVLLESLINYQSPPRDLKDAYQARYISPKTTRTTPPN